MTLRNLNTNHHHHPITSSSSFVSLVLKYVPPFPIPFLHLTTPDKYDEDDGADDADNVLLRLFFFFLFTSFLHYASSCIVRFWIGAWLGTSSEKSKSLGTEMVTSSRMLVPTDISSLVFWGCPVPQKILVLPLSWKIFLLWFPCLLIQFFGTLFLNKNSGFRFFLCKIPGFLLFLCKFLVFRFFLCKYTGFGVFLFHPPITQPI